MSTGLTCRVFRWSFYWNNLS